MPSEPRSREKLTSWSRTEVEQLVGWMEDNQERLRGKQMDWYKEVKDQVFKDDDHITVKRIKDKAVNMKNSWKLAKAMQEKSGWGLKADDCSQSIQDVLEKKCMLFWRLDEIWGSRPNATPIYVLDSAHTESQVSSGGLRESTSNLHEDIGIHVIQEDMIYGRTEACEIQEHRRIPEINDSSDDEEPAEPVQMGARNINSRDELDLDSDEPILSTPSHKHLQSESENAGRQSVIRSQRDFTNMSSVYGLPRREGRDKMAPIKRILDDRQEQMAEFENKRLRMEKELQREKIQAEDRRFNRQMEAQERIAKMHTESTAQVARIQAEAQTRQMQMFTNIFSILHNAQGGQRVQNIQEQEDTNNQEDRHDK